MGIPKIAEIPIYSYSLARSFNYAFQYMFLDSLSALVPGARIPIPPPKDKDRAVKREMMKLFRQDAKNIQEGIYPIQVLRPELPQKHIKRLFKIIWDGVSLSRRRAQGETSQFPDEAKDLLSELPAYYRRNFHFQTDGYLSERSAELYEHQVEILFAGAGDAMRRLVIAPLKKHFNSNNGKGLRFLEVGTGTGRASEFVRLAFPKAKIVVSDLSEPYLKIAEKKLSRYSGFDFMQADGAQLPFKDEHFDAVYSVFLFHELPLDARNAVLREAGRVLKAGGFIGCVDSVQTGDVPIFDSLLARFPKNYHEPFYLNYIANPLPDLFNAQKFTNVMTELGFFSKVCWGQKS